MVLKCASAQRALPGQSRCQGLASAARTWGQQRPPAGQASCDPSWRRRRRTGVTRRLGCRASLGMRCLRRRHSGLHTETVTALHSCAPGAETLEGAWRACSRRRRLQPVRWAWAVRGVRSWRRGLGLAAVLARCTAGLVLLCLRAVWRRWPPARRLVTLSIAAAVCAGCTPRQACQRTWLLPGPAICHPAVQWPAQFGRSLLAPGLWLLTDVSSLSRHGWSGSRRWAALQPVQDCRRRAKPVACEGGKAHQADAADVRVLHHRRSSSRG